MAKAGTAPNLDSSWHIASVERVAADGQEAEMPIVSGRDTARLECVANGYNEAKAGYGGGTVPVVMAPKVSAKKPRVRKPLTAEQRAKQKEKYANRTPAQIERERERLREMYANRTLEQIEMTLARARARYASNAEFRARLFEYRASRKVETRLYNEAYRLANKADLAARKKTQPKTPRDRERDIEYKKAFVAANREAYNARRREWHAANSERVAALKQAWRAKRKAEGRPEYTRESRRAYRAKKKAEKGTAK